MTSLDKSILKFVAWLSSSMVGVSAILYGLGFLVVQSHLNMLGVATTAVPSVDYLKGGGRFVVMNLMMVYHYQLAIIIVFAVFLLLVLARHVLVKLKNEDPKSEIYIAAIRPARDRYLSSERVQRIAATVGNWLLIIVLAAAIIVSLSKLPSYFITITINDLLLPAAPDALGAPTAVAEGGETITFPNGLDTQSQGLAEIIVSEIRSEDSTARTSRYLELLFYFVGLFFLLWFVSILIYSKAKSGPEVEVTSMRAVQRVFLCGAVAIAVFEFLLLPMVFGKLVVPNDFPVAYVTTTDKRLAEQIVPDRPVLVLLKNDAEVVLYDRLDPIFQSIVTVKRDDVNIVRVVGRESAF